MLRTLLGLALTWMASAAVVQTPLKADPHLKAPITMSVKYGRIDDVFKQLSKSSGVSIRASSNISDAKLAIFVKDFPCGQLLDDIASVLGYTWSSQDGVLILAPTQGQKSSLSNYLDAEDKKLRQKEVADSKALADISGGTLAQFTEALSGKGQGDDQNANQDTPPPTPTSLEGGMDENFAIGKMFHDFSSADWDSLWKGQVFYTALPQTQPSNEVQAGSEQQQSQTEDGQRIRLRRPRRRMIEQAVDSNLILVRYDVYGTHRLQNVRPPRTEANQQFEMPAMTSPEGDLAQLPFGESVLAWPSLDAATNDPAFAAVTATQAGIPKTLGEEGEPGTGQTYGESKRFSQDQTQETATVSDQLETFFNKTGIPVVADAFRVTVPPRTGGQTALDWLKNIQEVDHCFIRVEDGAVLVRHGGFWRLRQYEIPEKMIADMAAKKSPTLSDYAQFLSQLSPAQAASLRATNRPFLGFETSSVSAAIPGLQFLGSIGNVPSDTPVPFRELNSQQQQLFLNAIFEGLFAGGTWKGAGPGANSNNYGFLLSGVNVQREAGLVTGTSLLFGSSRNDGITFEVALKN
ncbi:MAG TPA: hypothetical protein VG944_08135 [Fimbriimonas sp.]|nr:hypothetical protein [Fimbriimonas sp.]